MTYLLPGASEPGRPGSVAIVQDDLGRAETLVPALQGVEGVHGGWSQGTLEPAAAFRPGGKTKRSGP
ncbi:hypothetical protein ACQEVF_29180 [Nonomuraea polychroma]|uniref:hypothetical protein n=1 Tax=Nonomuraea polychroma TaxID=46176 RepID=UPI003D8F7E1F